MGRKPKMTEDVKTVITKIHKSHPGWSVRDIIKKVPEFNKSLAGKVPGRTLVADFIKNLPTEELKVDKHWSIGVLDKYPYLKSVLKQLLIFKSMQFEQMPEKFTVRWALWFYKLEKLYYHPADESQARENIADIIILTSMYSDYEKQWEKAGLDLPADTSKFDDLDVETVKQNFLNWYKDDLEPDTFENLKEQMCELSELYRESSKKDGEENG